MLLLLFMKTIVSEVLTFDKYAELELPMYLSRISAGFPSFSDDEIDEKTDLTELLIKNPIATYFVRVTGDSMVNVGIHDGDILVVDRSIEPNEGKIVIAAVNGELTVKRLERRRRELYLVAENENYQPIKLREEDNFQIWGVVVYVIHKPD